MTYVYAVAMVLRVWAIYNGSRVILGTLLVLYTTEVILFLTSFIIMSAQFDRDPIGKQNGLILRVVHDPVLLII